MVSWGEGWILSEMKNLVRGTGFGHKSLVRRRGLALATPPRCCGLLRELCRFAPPAAPAFKSCRKPLLWLAYRS